MKDIFNEDIEGKNIEINIYADEVQKKICPYTKEEWIYIGIIIENLAFPLLDNVIQERFCHDFDEASPFFEKNNKIVHWADIGSADSKNICKRRIEYILNPQKSGESFYAYVLGINVSKINKEEFNSEDEFNSIYNRFFRSAILFSIKTFFPKRKIIVKNILHEEGQQKDHKYFPRHTINKIKKGSENIVFENDIIEFLPKDHKKDTRSNLVQLCDLFLGLSTTILHGRKESKRSSYRKELLELAYPLFERIIKKPDNKNSRYQYFHRIMMSFFPKDYTLIGDTKRYQSQFYNERKLSYEEERLKDQGLQQKSLFNL